MIAARRPAWNYALDRAVAWAHALHKPIVVLEALRGDYPWASDRLHRFVIEGMADNRRALGRQGVLYYPYVEPHPGAGKDLLVALAENACIVVTDEFPCFFLPRMVAAASRKIDVRVEVVDGNGLIPLAAADRAFTMAAHFRRFVQARIREHLQRPPSPRPFEGARLPRAPALSPTLTRRWPLAHQLLADPGGVSSLPIDHRVPPVSRRGGARAAAAALRRFVSRGLDQYHTTHNEPDTDATSRLSPYLHFGHVSAHEVFAAVMQHERWTTRKLRGPARGAREGWWHVRPGAEAFLDQLVVWRELAFNACAMQPDTYDRYESLPGWARATLDAHAGDPRPHVYGRGTFESASTHDALWNAAQRQLRREGWFHNYLRVLWGKKILEWSPTPPDALATMIHIMNRWALDGRNPNSYAGYRWTLGQFDRPWPERPIYGKVRSMSSERTASKVGVSQYLKRYGA
jgi:deoxyribodipyrimidine photo-lyase